MMTLEQIRQPVVAQMVQYEERLKDWLNSDYKAVAEILDYVVGGRGKGVRPLLVLLSHALNASSELANTQQRAFLGAMLVEMIHTASLLHDDVIDEAYMRRGRPSVNALWRSKSAVLAGDYILARSYTVGLESGNADIMTYITRSMSALCEGELAQSSQSEKLLMTRPIYIDIIDKKTASLISASSASGALAAGATDSQVEQMAAYGRNLGIAFQIQDDILDYSPSSKTGKPTCGDLRERKITLPLLAILDTASDRERRSLLSLLADVRTKPENVDQLYRVVMNGGGIAEAERVMLEYAQLAKASLSTYSDSPVKQSLLDLCDYVCHRDK